MSRWKKLWAVLLFALLSLALGLRVSGLIVVELGSADLIILLAWLALAFAPLFSEVEFLGVRLKRELEHLETRLRADIVSLRTDVSTSINSEFSPQFNFPLPPQDQDLPLLEDRIERAVARSLANRQNDGGMAGALEEPGAVPSQLFALRYNLEREVDRIWTAHTWGEPSTEPSRRGGVSRKIKYLTSAEILDPEISSAVFDLYGIASEAVHGGRPSEAKVRFAAEVGPQVLAALRAIRG